jgi:hypothetical protein
MEIDTKLTFQNKLYNFLTFNKDHHIKGFCGHCKRPVGDLNSESSKKGLCISCYNLLKLKKDILGDE